MGEVIQLLDHASVPTGAPADLLQWLRDWIDALETQAYGVPRSLVLVIETEDGQVATLGQSTAPLDGARQAGLLMYAIHRKMDGGACIEALRRG